MTTDLPAARILLIEDSETQALELRLMLERHAFAVERHASAESALDSLNQSLPDLILVDYQLPGMNGDELARQIRMNIRTRGIPILMLTSAPERDIERQGLESGADAYVPKSAGVAALILRLQVLLRERRPEGPGAEGGGTALFRRARMLIVDDSATFRAYLANELTQDGHTVGLHESFDDALLRSAEQGCDCAIINLSSASFDGFAACRALDRIRSGGKELFQIVGLWGLSSAEGVAEAFAAGADDVITRTTDTALIKVRIRALLRRKAMREENRRIEDEFHRSQTALERAKAEKEAAEEQAALAEEVGRTNRELAVANDKLRETQMQLVQAAKMASLGELVAGIAHQINNPLAFALGHQRTVARWLSEIAATEGGDATKLAKCLNRVEAMRLGLDRINSVIVNLRRFSRLDEGDFQPVDVVQSLDAVIEILGHRLRDGIALTKHFEGDAMLFCSPALIDQAVMNIISNAADAMQGHGTIAIATSNDADGYRIAIGDSGPGVPSEIRDRIFDPFFTTKPVGIGTGLGLAIAYGIVRAHQGNIEVGASSAGGALFTILVPRVQQTGQVDGG